MMTGRQLLIRALQGEATPRPAWLPLVGVHGGYLLGTAARQYGRSADAIVDGLARAAELYRPDGLAVPVDLQMEAEVLGCELAWADQTPPCVASHPLSANLDPACLLAFDLALGRYPLVLEAFRRSKTMLGDRIALCGLVTGPLTLAANLRGTAFFLDVFDNPDGVQQLARYCTSVAGQAAAPRRARAPTSRRPCGAHGGSASPALAPRRRRGPVAASRRMRRANSDV